MNAQQIRELAETALTAIGSSTKSTVSVCPGKYMEVVYIDGRQYGFRKVIGAIRFEVWRPDNSEYPDIYYLPGDLQDLAADLLSSFLGGP